MKKQNNKKIIIYQTKNKKFNKQNNKFKCEQEKFMIETTPNIFEDGILFQDENHEIKMFPLVTKRVKKGKVKEKDSTVIYEQYNNHDDLEYLVTSRGLKENIIIHKKRKAYQYKFLLKLKNLSFNHETLEFLDLETKKSLFKLSDFIMKDSNNQESNDIQVKIKEVSSQEIKITLLANSEWINNENRKFPVYLDPSIERKDSGLINFYVNNQEINTANVMVGFISKSSVDLKIKMTLNNIIYLINRNNLNRYHVFMDFKLLPGISNALSGKYSIYDDTTLFFNDRLDDKESFRLDITEIVKKCIEQNLTEYELTMKNDYTNPTGSTVESSDIIDNDYIQICSEYNEDETLHPSIILEYRVAELQPETEAAMIFNNGNAGISVLDLYDGNAIHEVGITSIKENNLEIGLNHIWNFRKFQNRSIDTSENYFGKGWKNNLHQYLVKDKGYDFLLKQNDILYIDGQGYIHEFKERWYYECCDEKIYVSKNDLVIDLDLKLKVKVGENLFEAKYECENNEGLTLVRGNSISNYEYKDRYTIQHYFYINICNEKYKLQTSDNIYLIPQYYFKEEEVSNDDNWIKETFETTGKSIKCRYYITDYLNISYDVDGNLIDTDGNKLYIDLNECYIIMKDNKYYARILKKKYFIDGQEIVQNYEEQGTDILLLDEVALIDNNNELNEDIFVNENLLNAVQQKEIIKKYIDKVSVNISEYSKSLISILHNKNVQYDLNIRNKNILNEETTAAVFIEKENYNKEEYLPYVNANENIRLIKDLMQKFNYEVTNENSQKQIKSAIIQLEQLIKEYDDYNLQYNSITKQINAMIEEQKNNVNDYIIDKEGNMLGFNGYGQLILIQDKYENKIEIEYDENHEKILSVYSNSQKVVFEYENELLNKIVDNLGRVTKFDYDDNNNLTLIDSHKGEQYKFNYSTSIDIINEVGTTLSLIYGNGNEISGVQKFYQKDTTINKNEIINSGAMEYPINLLFGFNENYTIYDNLSFQTYETKISFDSQGRVISKINPQKLLIANYDDNKLSFKGSYEIEKDKLFDIDALGLSQSITSTITIGEDIELNDIAQTQLLGLSIKLGSFNLSGLSQLLLVNMKVTLNTSSESITYEKSYQEVDNRILLLPFVVDSTLESIDLSITFSDSVNTTKIEDISLVKLQGTFFEYEEDNLIKAYNGFELTEYLDYQNDKPTKIRHTDKYNIVKTSKYLYDNYNRLTYEEDGNRNVKEYFYDNNNLIETREYNLEELTKAFVNKYQYDEVGNVANISNSLKNKKTNTKLEYVPGTSLIRKKLTGNNVICYGYDKHTDNLSSLSSDANGQCCSIQFGYNYGLLTTLQHNNSIIEYCYDALGRVIAIQLFGISNYATFEYQDNVTYSDSTFTQSHADVIIERHIDGYEKTSVYSRLKNRLVRVIDNGEIIDYTYDGDGKLTYIGGCIDCSYVYNNDNLSGFETPDIQTTFEYDEKERVEKIQVSINVINFATSLYYDEKDRVSYLSTNSLEIYYQYDNFNRIKEEQIEYNGVPSITNEYEYLQKEDQASNLVKNHNIRLNQRLKTTYEFEYDNNGNIISILEDETKTRYKYDSLNRLIREDNQKLNKTIIYTYDKGGNILLRKEYEYSLEEPQTFLNKNKYTYSLGNWKDKLSMINGEDINYDSMGRPIKYKGNTLSWNIKGQLTKYGDIEFRYDSNGNRTNKKVNNITHCYQSVNGKLLTEDYQAVTLKYYYALDKLIGFSYNEVGYIYEKNVLGDIVRIYEPEEGKLVAEYKYDAYGNHEIINYTEDNIGDINPFRYRGYYYDKETQLYWVSSRYYSPELCRWISPDSIEYLDPESINGLNLYCYCFNNPISYADPSGHFPFFLLTALLAVGITAAVDYIPDQEFDLHWGWYVGAVVVGAAVGLGISYYATGSAFSSVGKVFSGLFGKTTFYRTMSADDYATIQASGKLPAGTETFISPSSSYASTYNGVTVKFTVRNRTVNWLTKIGVKDGSTLVGSMYPSMPMVSKGWMATNAFFKAEQGIINIGLGYGRALDIFNKGIVMFGLL